MLLGVLCECLNGGGFNKKLTTFLLLLDAVFKRHCLLLTLLPAKKFRSRWDAYRQNWIIFLCRFCSERAVTSLSPIKGGVCRFRVNLLKTTFSCNRSRFKVVEISNILNVSLRLLVAYLPMHALLLLL